MNKYPKKKIIYVCDINDDIDDMIAVEYLHIIDALEYVVLDRPSDSNRVKELKDMGVKFKNEIGDDLDYKEVIVFCGGAFTKVADFIDKGGIISLLVANGGYAGDNLVKDPLEKFKGRNTVRTYNLNLDVNSALKVFESEGPKNIILVTKNVCHSIKNTFGNIHKDDFLKKYDLDSGKRLHDLLMVKEGLKFLNHDQKNCLCEYKPVNMFCKRAKKERYSEWGSSYYSHSKIQISTDWKK